MSDAEDDPTARELRGLFCRTCYRSLIGLVSGRSGARFAPCATCAPVAERWLAERQAIRRN